jgi:hypothetical protein
MVSTFGGLIGVMGIEHGLGEILQGNTVTDTGLILSWPDVPFFAALSGEPAFTLIPNLLITGILAVLFSLAYLVCAVWFVRHRHGALTMMLLTVPMFLFGAGIFPPFIGLLIGIAATRIHAPLSGWRRSVSSGVRRSLGAAWPWLFGAGLVAWLGMFPGVPFLAHFFGFINETLIYTLLGCMFGFLFLSSLAGLARDARSSAPAA